MRSNCGWFLGGSKLFFWILETTVPPRRSCRWTPLYLYGLTWVIDWLQMITGRHLLTALGSRTISCIFLMFWVTLLSSKAYFEIIWCFVHKAKSGSDNMIQFPGWVVVQSFVMDVNKTNKTWNMTGCTNADWSWY